MTKVDRSKKTCFEKESKTNSKNNISLCSFLFLTNSKGILYKALRSVNECSAKDIYDSDFISQPNYEIEIISGKKIEVI